MKRVQLNLVLGVVVAGLAVAVWLSQEKEDQGPPLTSLKVDDIGRIAVEHPDAPAIRLHKQDGRWQLVEPIQAEADPLEVNALLGLATLETRLKLEPAQLKLADLGLDPPGFRVRLNELELQFGGVEPLNYRRYVKLADQVVLVEDPPSAALDADYADLVSRKLLPEGAEIEKIVLPGLTIAKAGEQGWTLSPEQPQAGSDAKQKLVDGWHNARAMWMAQDAETPKGEDVVVTLRDGSERRFVVVQRDPQLVLARPDVKLRYTLSKTLESELLKLPDETPEAQPAAPAADDAAAAEADPH